MTAVQIEQSFEVPFPMEAVWRCFHDTGGIVACLPGASLSAAPEGGRLPLTMTVKLGPIVANFAGEALMAMDDARRAGEVSGGGSDRKSGSRVKGSARFALAEPAAGRTRVDIAVEYSIAGSLAQFSRGGIVQELAERLTLAFRDNLKAMLEAAPAAAASAAQAAPIAGVPAGDSRADAQGGPAARPAAAPALDLGGMFWALLLQRLRRLLGLAARS